MSPPPGMGFRGIQCVLQVSFLAYYKPFINLLWHLKSQEAITFRSGVMSGNVKNWGCPPPPGMKFFKWTLCHTGTFCGFGTAIIPLRNYKMIRKSPFLLLQTLVICTFRMCPPPEHQIFATFDPLETL